MTLYKFPSYFIKIIIIANRCFFVKLGVTSVEKMHRAPYLTMPLLKATSSSIKAFNDACIENKTHLFRIQSVLRGLVLVFSVTNEVVTSASFQYS